MKKTGKQKPLARRPCAPWPTKRVRLVELRWSERRGVLRLPVNGEEISVPSALHLDCPRMRRDLLSGFKTPSGCTKRDRDLPERAIGLFQPMKCGDPRSVQSNPS